MLVKFPMTIIAAILLAAVAACGEEKAKHKLSDARETAIRDNLEYTVLQTTRVPREIAFDGVIEALNQAVVSAQTSGRIVELPYDVGDFVAKGALIARFTDKEQQAALAAAKSKIEEARAHASEAEKQFVRIAQVHSKGLVAKAEYDAVVAAQQAAKARLETAKAALNEAKERVSHTRVVAPYSGIVVKRLTDIGASVAPGTPLLEGLSLDQLRVRVSIPQRHIGPLRQYKKARVLVNDLAAIAVSEMRISPSADVATNSFLVLLTLPDGLPAEVLFPGTLAKVAFVVAESNALLVPKAAVAYRGEVTAVYVENPTHQIEFRYIRLGQTVDDEYVRVLAGLKAGEKVMLDPVAGAMLYKTAREEY